MTERVKLSTRTRCKSTSTNSSVDRAQPDRVRLSPQQIGDGNLM